MRCSTSCIEYFHFVIEEFQYDDRMIETVFKLDDTAALSLKNIIYRIHEYWQRN